uniref:M56 family metallopeptidase n=1 Tax=Arenibacter lacus TaxID=2608629 RepID=UPI0029394D24
MIQYILECMAFQLLFLIVYDLFLKKETFFQWNRAYLLSSFVLSIVLPWIKIEALKTTVSQESFVYPEYLWGMDMSAGVVATPELSASIQLSTTEMVLYGGMLLAAVLFCFKLYQIVQLKRKGEIRYFKSFTRIMVHNSQMAFSFFRSIFIGDKVLEKDHDSIIQHELVHIEQRHSLDLLFFELMRIIAWFNPLVYVYQNRISELHEFIADAKVAKTHKAAQYQMLLSQAFQTQNISFINHFYKSSLIKKRIVMLQKTKSKQIWRLKYLLMLPLVLG